MARRGWRGATGASRAPAGGRLAPRQEGGGSARASGTTGARAHKHRRDQRARVEVALAGGTHEAGHWPRSAALRLARRQPGPPRDPRGRGARTEARGHQELDAGPLAGGGKAAPRQHRPGTLAGLRDRALLSVMLYSFARVSAVLGMRRQDYFQQGSRGWLRLHEKGGKRHDVPAHHRAAEALDEYLEVLRARGRGGGAVSERGPDGGEAERGGR